MEREIYNPNLVADRTEFALENQYDGTIDGEMWTFQNRVDFEESYEEPMYGGNSKYIYQESSNPVWRD